MLNDVEWGKYKIGDLFEVKRGLSMYVNDKNSFTYVSNNHPNAIRLVQQLKDNNGIIAYVDGNNLPEKFKSKVEKAGQITINPDQPMSFYQDKEFIGNSVIIIDTSNLSKNICLYLVGEIQRIRRNSTWNDKFPKEQVKVAEISLPCKDGKIDFEFMDKFIDEIKKQSFSELQNYLIVSNLKDYELTKEEMDFINSTHSSEKNIKSLLDDVLNKKTWKEFCMGDLFERIKTNKLTYKAKELPTAPTDTNPLPCLTSSFMNQGLNYYVPKENATILKNVISIPSNSDVYRAYYQSLDFTVLSDAYAIKWKNDNDKITGNQYLFLVSCINKFTDLPIYSYKNKLGGWNVVKNKNILLPVKDGKIDFDFMEKVVMILKKIIIKDVVLYIENANNKNSMKFERMEK